MKLSVVIPARNEAEIDRGDAARDHRSASNGEEIDYEIIVVDDASSDGTAAVVERLRRARTRACAACARTIRNGFGFAVRAGLEAFDGDAVAIVMADGSDDPRDLVLYHELLEEGYDCAFGSRFMPGADGHRLSALQAARSTGSSTAASGCCSATATTTRRTPSRRTGAR